MGRLFAVAKRAESRAFLISAMRINRVPLISGVDWAATDSQLGKVKVNSNSLFISSCLYVIEFIGFSISALFFSKSTPIDRVAP